MPYYLTCEWGPANHFLFQCANAFLLCSYITPNSAWGMLYLRFVLAGAGFCFAAWGYFVLCSLDTVVWNTTFAVFNMIHLIYLIRKRQPLQRFDSDHESVYAKLFQPFGLTRYDYKPLAELSYSRILCKGEYYAEEDVSIADHLSVVMSGSVVVSQGGQEMRTMESMEFVDAPEWITGSDNYPAIFQISLTGGFYGATVLSWNREKLLRILNENPSLRSAFDSAMGKDLAFKIFKQNETFTKESISSGEIGISNASFYADLAKPQSASMPNQVLAKMSINSRE